VDGTGVVYQQVTEYYQLTKLFTEFGIFQRLKSPNLDAIDNRYEMIGYHSSIIGHYSRMQNVFRINE